VSGTLSVVATPIGNLDDLSPRAARTLASADVIACEDTRVTRALLNARVPEARARLVALHARNEAARVPELVRAVASGSRVALATDAGMPGISDPGHRLVEACAEAGLRVEVVPGPSAVLSALVASGLPTARFVFEGFLPRTGGGRRRRLEALAAEERTLVLFESPHRAAESLRDVAAVLGGARRAVVARELTKMHEEIARGTLDELAARAAEDPFRGEITLVVEGAAPREAAEPDAESLADAVARRVRAGETKKDAIAAVAAEQKVRKRAVYDAVIARG
jgi:16S rRNA (cytidine1402-2'-O)-methyltransferase